MADKPPATFLNGMAPATSAHRLLLALLVVLLPCARAVHADGSAAAERVSAGLGSSDPARRRAALEELQRLAPTTPEILARVLPALRDILRTRGPDERAPAARALAVGVAPEVERAWLAVLLDDTEDERVLRAAIDGLAVRAPDARLALHLLETSNDKALRPTQRALALEALGAVGGPAADLRLGLTRPGADWVEEAGRVLGIARRGGPLAVPRLIECLGSDDACPRTHAWEELTHLTGQRLPVDQPAWEAWWAAERTKVAPPAAPSAPPAPPDPDARYARPEGAHVPHYYGVPIPRRGDVSRVVFCCDVSQSMYGFPLERSRKELLATLKELTLAHRFDVIAFNELALPWAGRLVRAHPVQKVRAMDWFLALEPTSYTNLYDAVEIGLGYAGRGRRKLEPSEPLDALFVLSDGEPNRGRYRTAKELLREIPDLARPGIPIHTIGAGEAAYELLRALAAATGGTFTDAFE